jgi:23S rRNA (pseudouridine1915-N3)-methyltransferase
MASAFGQITVVAVGKVRAAHWAAAQDEYVKRLGRYTSFRLIEVRDMVGRGVVDAVAVEREGEELLRVAERSPVRVLLSADGRAQTSEGLAAWLQKQMEGSGHVAFLIGGPLGFSEPVRAAVPDRLSLSPMTFPHELARVMLLEQLFRAFTILRGEPYHK